MISKLARKQFDILEALAETGKPLTQRELEKETGHSLGTVNRVSKELSALNYIENSTITNAGLKALEPYRAKRAVFIAAGFGTRLVPITLNTPKPLVRVKGQRIIDGLIDACLNVGISEIYIVRGYLAEQFDQLLYKYPMIKFLENPMYNEANNISSAMTARYTLSNSYVFEADLLLSNPRADKALPLQIEFSGHQKGLHRRLVFHRQRRHHNRGEGRRKRPRLLADGGDLLLERSGRIPPVPGYQGCL